MDKENDNPGVRYLYDTFCKDSYKPNSSWCLPSKFKLDPILYKNQFEETIVPNIDTMNKQSNI